MAKVAVDAVLLLPDVIMEATIRLNKELLKRDDRKVVLDKETCLPHISLAMGVFNKDAIPSMGNALETITRKFAPLYLSVVGISTKVIRTGERISSLEIAKNPDLQRLHEGIWGVLSPHLAHDTTPDMFLSPPAVEEISLDWVRDYSIKSSFANFSPHITVGLGDLPDTSIEVPAHFVVSRLAFCHLGNYCTCRKILFATELKA